MLTARELVGMVKLPKWRVVNVRYRINCLTKERRMALACRKWRLMHPDKVSRGGKVTPEQANANRKRWIARHPRKAQILSLLTTRKYRGIAPFQSREFEGQ